MSRDTLGQTTVRSRKRKVLSRKRKLGLDLFLSGIYLFPALQNIYYIGVWILGPAMGARHVKITLLIKLVTHALVIQKITSASKDDLRHNTLEKI